MTSQGKLHPDACRGLLEEDLPLDAVVQHVVRHVLPPVHEQLPVLQSRLEGLCRLGEPIRAHDLPEHRMQARRCCALVAVLQEPPCFEAVASFHAS